jgi:hypothetical protein
MRLLLTLAVFLATLAPSSAETPRVLAEYPNGTFLENVVATQKGALVATSYFAKTLELIEPGKPARTLTTLPAHPVGIVRYRDGYLVSAHGAPFTGGPAFTQAQQLLLLGPDGSVRATIAAPDARFLNGIVAHTGNTVLVADSIAGVIWKVDPAAKSIEPWLKDPALGQDPAAKDFRPGANGLKRRGTALLVSNSSLGHLASIRVDAKGNAVGAASILAKTGAIDDFLVGASGDVVFTTHSAELKRLRSSGKVDTILSTGCDGCTSLARFRDNRGRRGIAVLTTGNLLEGGKQPARVLFLPVTP